MSRLLRSNKAQAATEIAIVGAIIILVFSYLITFTVKLNQKQLYIQKAFRAALDRAKSAGTASASMVGYKHMPNIVDPYAPGQIEGFSGGAMVLRSATGGGIDAEIERTTGDPDEAGSYTKIIRRTEQPGQLPQTRVFIDNGSGESSVFNTAP